MKLRFPNARRMFGGFALFLLLIGAVLLRWHERATDVPAKFAPATLRISAPHMTAGAMLRPLPVSISRNTHDWTAEDAMDLKMIERIAHNPGESKRLTKENARIKRRQLTDLTSEGVCSLFKSNDTGTPTLTEAATFTTGKLRIALTRNTAATDLTLSVIAADSLTGPWIEIARSTDSAAFTAIAPGALVNETGAGTVRNVESTDIILITDLAHPERFLRLEVSR